MADQTRSKIIVEYISNHQGCTAQNIVDGVSSIISRVPVFDIIKGLVNEEIIKDQRTNRREHRYFVEANNPLVSVPQELDAFEKAFTNLFGNTNQDFSVVFMMTAIEIFSRMVNAYIHRSTLIWPSRFQDKEVLRKLYAIVFEKIADIQLHLSELLKKSDTLDPNLLTLELRFSDPLDNIGIKQIMCHLKIFTHLGKKNEIEEVIDAFWSISKEIQGYQYPEPGLYNWDFDYGVDDWRKLIKLQSEHPNETLYGAYKKEKLLNRRYRK